MPPTTPCRCWCTAPRSAALGGPRAALHSGPTAAHALQDTTAAARNGQHTIDLHFEKHTVWQDPARRQHPLFESRKYCSQTACALRALRAILPQLRGLCQQHTSMLCNKLRVCLPCKYTKSPLTFSPLLPDFLMWLLTPLHQARHKPDTLCHHHCRCPATCTPQREQQHCMGDAKG